MSNRIGNVGPHPSDEDNGRPPWEGRPSIYAHIVANLDPQSACLAEEAEALPDEARRFEPGKARWAAGALDGVLSHHVGVGDGDDAAETVVGLTVSVARNGSHADKLALYRALEPDQVLSYIDSALDQAMQAGIAAEPYLHDFARLLARAPDRGPVKFGIALLGVIGDPQDTALVNTLGKHDEFTLFSTVALMNIVNSPERALFELAKCVEGWGRIHLVERLANTEDADIKNWLIRHGYKNSITVEYLAYTCAQAGELHVALREARVDQELLDTSGDIIEALIMGGPARDMDDYEKAADVIEHYLRHLRQRPASVKHFLVLQAIQGYLEDDEWDPAQRIENGWLPGRREGVLATVAELLDDDIWQQLAHSQLSSQDEAEFHQAERAADILGIETWSVHWQRLQDMPSEPGRWHFVMRKANADNIDAILSFAERVLPLEEIASGPSEALALGPEYRWHSCLDFVLQDLDRFPGKGKKLLLAGLASPSVRNRNMALKALSAWQPDLIDQEMLQALDTALQREPDDRVKENIKQVLRTFQPRRHRFLKIVARFLHQFGNDA